MTDEAGGKEKLESREKFALRFLLRNWLAACSHVTLGKLKRKAS